MRRIIGIFGGTFNPVHNGHTETINYLLETIPFDKILIIPNAVPPHKKVKNVSFEHRLRMVTLAFRNIRRAEVDNREVFRDAPSYAINTVKEILEEEKNAKVIMIVGSDTFSDIQDWYKYKELLTLVDFIVMNRPNFPLPINKDAYNLVNKNLVLEDFLKETSKKGVFEIKVTPLSISSSLIRRDVLRGKELKHLINPEVEKYLKKHKLYESKSSV